MRVTEVQVKLVHEAAANEKLLAFANVVLDDAVVIRDLKVIEGAKGAFVAMPSRKLTDRCPLCGGKNHLKARFCNDCGARLADGRGERDEDGRVKLHADVAHPIRREGRALVQFAVLRAYEAEAAAGLRALEAAGVEWIDGPPLARRLSRA